MCYKIAKQTKNGGNIPPIGLFLYIYVFLRNALYFLSIEYFGEIAKNQSAEDIETSELKKRGCIVTFELRCTLFFMGLI